MALISRWWPLTGFVFVGLFIGCFAYTDSSPDTTSSDESILSYYAKNSNQTRDMIGFFMLLAAVLFFVLFLSGLRARLARFEGTRTTLTALAFGAGIVSAALWVAAACMFAAPAFGLDENDSKLTLDPNTFRLLSTIGYGLWFSAVTVAAIMVTATAVLALRTGLLPKWLAWLSFPVALTMLVAFFFIPFLIMCGWILVVAIVVMASKETPEAAAAPASA